MKENTEYDSRSDSDSIMLFWGQFRSQNGLYKAAMMACTSVASLPPDSLGPADPVTLGSSDLSAISGLWIIPKNYHGYGHTIYPYPIDMAISGPTVTLVYPQKFEDKAGLFPI